MVTSGITTPLSSRKSLMVKFCVVLAAPHCPCGRSDLSAVALGAKAEAIQGPRGATPGLLCRGVHHRGRRRRGPVVPRRDELIQLQFVNIRRRLRKQRGFLRLAVRRGNPFEGVPDHLIAALALVRREVAFEHAALGTEGLDAGFHIGAPRGGGLLRRGWFRALVEIEAEQ